MGTFDFFLLQRLEQKNVPIWLFIWPDMMLFDGSFIQQVKRHKRDNATKNGKRLSILVSDIEQDVLNGFDIKTFLGKTNYLQ